MVPPRKFYTQFIYSMRPYEADISAEVDRLIQQTGVDPNLIDRREMIRLWIIDKLRLYADLTFTSESMIAYPNFLDPAAVRQFLDTRPDTRDLLLYQIMPTLVESGTNLYTDRQCDVSLRYGDMYLKFL